jgi:hypothetical protein
MLEELSKVRFARFRFHLKARTPLCLPPYKGSTLRGGFGLSFKDAICVVAHRDCERCILTEQVRLPLHLRDAGAERQPAHGESRARAAPVRHRAAVG